jgi:hypothetical protein
LVQNLSEEIVKEIEKDEIISLPNYYIFFDFFSSKVGLSSKEIRDTFLWIQHQRFKPYLNYLKK